MASQEELKKRYEQIMQNAQARKIEDLNNRYNQIMTNVAKRQYQDTLPKLATERLKQRVNEIAPSYFEQIEKQRQEILKQNETRTVQQPFNNRSTTSSQELNNRLKNLSESDKQKIAQYTKVQNSKMTLATADNISKETGLSKEQIQEAQNKKNSLPSKILNTIKSGNDTVNNALGINNLINNTKETAKQVPNVLNTAKEISTTSPTLMGLRGSVAGTADAGTTEMASLLEDYKEDNRSTTEKILRNIVRSNPALYGAERLYTQGKNVYNTANRVFQTAKKLDEQNASVGDKIWGIGSNALVATYEGVKNSVPALELVEEEKNLIRKLTNKTLSKDERQELQNKLLNLTGGYYEDMAKYQQNESKKSKAMQYVDRAIETTARMAPSIATTATTGNPDLGLAMMGLSAKGNATQSALKNGATLEQAIEVGDLNMITEMATEKLFPGLKMYGGKSAVGKTVFDGVEKWIKDNVKRNGAKWVARALFDILGEQAEEVIADVTESAVNRGVYDENQKAPTLKELVQTMKDTAGSTMLLNLITGGYIGDYQNIKNEQKVNQMQQVLNEIEKNENNVQNPIKNQNNNLQQQITQTENKNGLNQNVEGQNLKTNNIIDNLVSEYINNNKDNIKPKIDIDTKIIDNGNETLPMNYSTAKEAILYQKAKGLFSRIGKRVFKNNNQDIYVTNADISESIHKTITSVQQKKYAKENVAVFSQLDKIIENAKLISTNKEDNKGRNQYGNYEYYICSANIDGKPYIVEFDTRLQKGVSGKLERHFRLERVYNIEEVSSVIGTDNSINQFVPEDTSSNNSIPQNNENVKKIESKQYLEQKFKELTGDSITKAEAVLGGVDLRNSTRKDGKVESYPYSQKALDILNKYQDSKKSSNYLYHSTSKENIKSIIENGLTTGNKQNQEGVSSLDKVYLSATEELAKSFAPSDNITFRINPKADLKNLSNDLLGGEGSYSITNNIPANMLQVKENGKWVNLNNSQLYKENINLPTKETSQKTSKTDELNLPKANKDLEEIRSSTIDKIVDKRGKPKSSFKQVAGYLNQKLINKGYYIDQLAKQTKNPELTYKYDRLLNAFSEAQYSIGQAQTDNNNNKVGKSLIEIFKPADDANLAKEFDDYLLNRHNIDRKAVEKSIFGEAITAKDSQKTVAEYEAKHPEFKKWAEDVYKYNDNQLQGLVDAGFISKETQDMLHDLYGAYVPTYRNIIDTMEEIQDTNEGRVNGNPLKRAKGGSQEIISIREAMAEQTVAYKRALRMNEIGQELLKILGKDKVLNDNVDIQYASPEAIYSLAGNVVEKTKGGNIFTVFKDGNAYELKINDDLYSAFEPTLINKIAKNQKLSAVLNPIAKITQWHKNLLTTYSVGFSFNNPIKDFQDALINTKYSSAEFIKNYPRALKQIATKGEYYDSYKRNGGFANSYFDYEKGLLPTKRNVAQKVFIDSIRNMNEVIEQAPRLAEYITTLEHGGTVNEAMYNAAEVTINFKRGGDVTKAMNKYGAEFLNASVQGMDKIYRNITGQNGFKGYASLLAKAVIYNVAPAVLNHLLLRDDDDYEELSDYNKNNYFLFKLGDGKFLRIPKGRVSSVMGTIAREMLEAGEGKGLDIKNIKDTAINQVAPNNPLTDNIISPLMAVKDNKAWYGGKIVKDSLAKLPEGEQYDETTDIISKFVGEKTNISPKKINYLLDQYSGGIGDVILPMLTPQAENNIIEDKFTTDSVIKNKYPSEFYETIDELEKKKNSLGATEEDVIKYKYLSSVSSDLADLYKEKHEIQNSTKSDKEKKEAVREVQDKINKKTKEALENAENAKITSDTAEIGDKQYYNYKGEWTKVTDKEKEKNKDISLKTYADYKNKVAKKANGDTVKNEDKISVILESNYSNKEKEALYENYVSDETYLNVMKYSGININEYLKYKQQKFEADKVDDGTEKGKSVSGSKKQKVYDYVNNMNITGKQRMLLLGTQYKLTNSERRILANYVNELNITKNQKIDIYKKLQGFTVYKDGRVTF